MLVLLDMFDMLDMLDWDRVRLAIGNPQLSIIISESTELYILCCLGGRSIALLPELGPGSAFN